MFEIRRTARLDLTVALMVAVLLSLGGINATLGAPVGTPCGEITDAAICGTGSCPFGQSCQPGDNGCVCEVNRGCCDFSDQAVVGGGVTADSMLSVPCVADFTEAQCAGNCGGFAPGMVCGASGCVEPSPTATATSTPTSTPTATSTPQLPDGAACNDPIACLSGNCVDGVCCDTPCSGPGESCNQSGSVGICSEVPATAPAASKGGLLLTIAILVGVAVATLRRRSAA